MASVFDDFFVDFIGDFGHGVICWTIEFVGFGGGGIVMAHYFKGLADIDGLVAGFSIWWMTDDWSKAGGDLRERARIVLACGLR